MATVLVLGATGNVGKATTQELLKLASSRPVRVIAAVRDTKKAADLKREGAELREFNFDDNASLSAVFKGVTAAFIVPPNPAANSKPFDRAHIANRVRSSNESDCPRSLDSGNRRSQGSRCWSDCTAVSGGRTV